MSRAVVIGLAAVIGFQLAAPPHIRACTGCSPTFDEFVPATNSIALVRWERRAFGTDVFAVLDVMKGPPLHGVRLYSDYLRGENPNGRWILIDEGYLALLRVDARGKVTDPFDQLAAISDLPDTLNGWSAAIRRIPDTATTPLAVAPSPPGTVPLTWLLAAAIGLAIGWHRFWRRPRRGRSGVLGVAMAALIVASCAVAPRARTPGPAAPAPTHTPIPSPAASSVPAASTTTTGDVSCTPLTMREHRAEAITVGLADGRVLILGGYDTAKFWDDDARLTPTWEMFDPRTNTFEAGGKMPGGAWPILATPLADGRVLVLTDGKPLLFDPAKRSFSSARRPIGLRAYSFAVQLMDGRVLVAGYSEEWAFDRDVELFDPVTRSWAVTGSMHTTRFDPGVALLADGRVLVAGGDMGIGEDALNIVHDSAELYDPKTGRFVGARPMSEPRSDFPALLLNDGQVLIAYGPFSDPPDAVEIYNPRTGRFTRTGAMVAAGSSAAVRMADGRIIFFVAATDDPSDLGSATMAVMPAPSQVYDPASGKFSELRLMNPFEEFTATALKDGRVLLVGDANTALVCRP